MSVNTLNIEKRENGKFNVSYQGDGKDGQEVFDTFDEAVQFVTSLSDNPGRVNASDNLADTDHLDSNDQELEELKDEAAVEANAPDGGADNSEGEGKESVQDVDTTPPENESATTA